MRLAKLFVVIATFAAFEVHAQPEWTGRTFATVGATVHLYRGKGQHFPGFRMFVSGNIQGYNSGWLVCYSLSAVLYTKSIGASLNPLVGDVQLDVINSVSGGYTGGDQLGYSKYFRTIGIGDFYNVALDRQYGAIIGTNLILNNHRRNQMVGHVAVSVKNFTLNYSNDGAPPVSTLSLGDEFDRWWTGGVGMFIHRSENYNLMELSFDQFTGYSPQLYEMSNLLGIDVPRYGNLIGTDKYGPPAFNTSTYKAKFFPTPGMGIDVGVIGSLRSPNDTSFGLQEIIHLIQGFSVHPNRDINRWYIGASYIHLATPNEK